MDKAYEPKDVEARRYAEWEAGGFFHPDAMPGTPKYSVTIPPPNVTGSLHMGHALTYTVQDVLGRWKRMSGFTTLILPGTDHAGIATQNVVEKQIAKEGLTRFDLGREAFTERVWQWKEEYGARIITQLKRLGCGFDWKRERFTFDAAYAAAVSEAFVRFHDAGLIYKGNRMVNWCPRCRTVISDIEVEEEEQAGHLWHIRYPFADGTGEITVATTRPETMLGDTAVAVNPADPRAALAGKMLSLPLTEREIPLIADDYAALGMGTGAVKVTPAHDPNDYEAGLRHSLPQITVIGFDGNMTADAGERYSGLDRYEARNLVVADLDQLGLLEKTEDHPHRVPTCERCHTTIEPLLSDQWFMKMTGTELVRQAMEVVEQGDITFAPARYKRIYLDWMAGLRDWPLSRQLWWGHRIPIYYKADGSYVAARSLAEAQERAGTGQLTQDEDVLDTWFSSALWPFATLGWPAETPDLAYFYPTDVLTTSREILYLWVARMIMTGLEFRGERPFREVYIFATVLDKKGRRMSKSLGNGIDPVEMIDRYGADALRFSLLRLASKGQDIRFSEDRIPDARNFGNKLWNAARFVLMHAEDGPHPPAPSPADAGEGEQKEQAERVLTLACEAGEGGAPAPGEGLLALPHRWILSRLARTTEKVNAAFGSYDFDEACAALYEFVWNEFCDWYVELCKPALQGDNPDARRPAQATLLLVLETVLRLLHPLMPFMTEEIWAALPSVPGERGPLCIAPFPQAEASLVDEDAERGMALVLDSITALRALRADFTPGGPENEAARAVILNRRFTVTVVPDGERAEAVLREQMPALTNLARLGTVTLSPTPPEGKNVPIGVPGVTFYVPANELLEGVDPARETVRLAGEIAKLDKELTGLNARLANPSFVERAAPDAVDKARQDAADLAARRDKLTARQALLSA